MELDKTSDNKIPERDENGRLLPGNTANSEGRPKGTGLSITTAIKRELVRVPEGQKESYLILLIKRILKKAVVDGDIQMIKQVWNYIDGMPKQQIEQSGAIEHIISKGNVKAKKVADKYEEELKKTLSK